MNAEIAQALATLSFFCIHPVLSFPLLNPPFLSFPPPSHRPTPALDLELFPRSFRYLKRTNLLAMFISFIGLVLASTISAKVIDIQVSDDNASLAFNPEAIVSFNPRDLCVSVINDHSVGRRPW